jgi:hypothetical protein
MPFGTSLYVYTGLYRLVYETSVLHFKVIQFKIWISKISLQKSRNTHFISRGKAANFY